MANNFETETNFDMEKYLEECNDVVLESEDFEGDCLRFKTPNEAFKYINDNFEEKENNMLNELLFFQP